MAQASAEVIVKFTIKYLADNEECIEYGFSGFEDGVRYLINEEGLFGVVDDDYEILSIKEKSK